MEQTGSFDPPHEHTMQKHPDADAFMRAYLQQPTDATARLVFADWLEETGAAHNAAWAHYIRLKIEAGRAATRRDRRELDRRAEEFALEIRARLALAAGLFVTYPKSLLELLPASNIVVRIGPFQPAATVIDGIDEELARSFPILPLDNSSGALIVAHPTPLDPLSVALVRDRLSESVIVVGGLWEEITGALNVAYDAARLREELREEVFADLPLEFDTVPGAYPVGSAVAFVDDVLQAGDRRHADLVTFIPQGDLVRVCYRTHAGPIEAGRISRADWTYRVLPEITRRGEATGTDFTVEIVRHGEDRAVRIWRG
jgi:uncharacterized protein (TIGR02996 family)